MEFELKDLILPKDSKECDSKCAKTKKSYEVDKLTEIIGEVGPWQLLWVGLPDISIAVHCWMMMSNKWLTYKTDHWCARPAGLDDLTREQWLNLSSPILADGSFDKCHMFDLNYNETFERPDEGFPVIPCSNWEYDESIFQVQNFHCSTDIIVIRLINLYLT